MSQESRIEVFKTSPEMFSSEKLQALHAYWDALRGDRDLPRRDQLSPVDLGFILGQVTMIDVLSEPTNFYYRLIGTRIEELGRQGDQGKTVDQIRPACYRQLCRDAYREVTGSLIPLCLRVCRRRNDTEVSYERMILPFSQDGTRVDVLLDGLDWEPGMQIDLKRYRLLPSANVSVDLVLS